MKNAVLIVLSSLLLSACGSVFQPAPTPTLTQDRDAPVFNISLHEFAFEPDRIKLRVGQHVTFHVTNGGATDHELMIGRNPLRDENGELGDGFEHDFFALTKPEVTGDAQVMGMAGGDMNMDMGDATPEGEMAMSTGTPEGEMAMGTETSGSDMGDMENMGEAEMQNGFMAMFESGQEATISFTVTEDMVGTWTMGCFEVDQGMVHFDEGMVGNVIVLPK